MKPRDWQDQQLLRQHRVREHLQREDERSRARATILHRESLWRGPHLDSSRREILQWRKGFGFINQNGGSPDSSVHRISVGGKALMEGDEVAESRFAENA